ncbi:zinc ribbon domain-containing protein [Bacillus cereus]
MVYKAKWYSKQVITVSKAFAPIELCIKNKDAKNLTIRKSDGLSCETHHDSDRNAAINLGNEIIHLCTIGNTWIDAPSPNIFQYFNNQYLNLNLDNHEQLYYEIQPFSLSYLLTLYKVRQTSLD